MSDTKNFIIPLRLRGLPAYVVTKTCLGGLHGLNRTQVVERAVNDYFMNNDRFFTQEGLTLENAVSQGYVLDQTKHKLTVERFELNGRSFVVRPEFSGYPAYLIDWHASNGLYGATRRGVVSGLLDRWVIDISHNSLMNTSFIEAERLGYLPVRR